MFTNTPYELGFRYGYESGMTFDNCLSQNPYQSDSDEYAEWERGCKDGMVEWLGE